MNNRFFFIILILFGIVNSQNNLKCAIRIIADGNIGTATYLKLINENNKYYIITAYHVVCNKNNISLQLDELRNASSYLIDTIIKPEFICRPEFDLVIFECSVEGRKILNFHRLTPLEIDSNQINYNGGFVKVIGNPNSPLGRKYSVFNDISFGIISHFIQLREIAHCGGDEGNTTVFVIKNLRLSEGFSGGPALLEYGNKNILAGIINGGIGAPYYDISWGIPTRFIVQALNERKSSSRIYKSPWPEQKIREDNFYALDDTTVNLLQFEVRKMIINKNSYENQKLTDTISIYRHKWNKIELIYRIKIKSATQIYANISADSIESDNRENNFNEIRNVEEDNLVRFNFTIKPFTDINRRNINIIIHSRENDTLIIHKLTALIKNKPTKHSIHFQYRRSLSSKKYLINKNGNISYRCLFNKTNIYLQAGISKLSEEIHNQTLPNIPLITQNYHYYEILFCIGLQFKFKNYQVFPISQISGLYKLNYPYKGAKHEDPDRDNFTFQLDLGLDWKISNKIDIDAGYMLCILPYEKLNFKYFGNSIYVIDRRAINGIQFGLTFNIY